MLEIEQIRKTFHPGTPNEVRALQDVDLRIEPGSFVIVIGMNGSGKSTLLNAVAGSFFCRQGTTKIKGPGGDSLARTSPFEIHWTRLPKPIHGHCAFDDDCRKSNACRQTRLPARTGLGIVFIYKKRTPRTSLCNGLGPRRSPRQRHR